MILAALVAATMQANLISNGDFKNGFSGWQVTAVPGCVRSLVSDPIYGSALKLELSEAKGAPEWEYQCQQRIDSAIQSGETLELRFFARSLTHHKVTAYLELAGTPYTSMSRQSYSLSPDWREYKLAGRTSRAYAANELQTGLHLNTGSGVVELANFRLVKVPDGGKTKVSDLLVPSDYSNWRFPGVEQRIDGGVLTAKFSPTAESMPWNHLIGAQL